MSKFHLTYTVNLCVNEDKTDAAADALKKAAKEFDSEASVEELDCTEQEEEDEDNE